MTEQPQDTARKVVVVTGASSGIGEAAALRLASEGHHVVLGARREERLEALVRRIRDSGGSAVHRRLDVTDLQSVRAVVDDTVSERGRVDALVNNAGVMPLSRMDALLVEEWNQMVDVNVRGLLNGVAATLPHFQRQGSGHLVTIASVGAHEVVPTSAVYSGTKFAAWAITEGLRLELDPAIRVTTVSPGVVESELAEHITDPAAREAMRTYRRHALPADAIAGAISFALGQPPDVDVNEIVVRPAAQR
ncbi:MULTISPECIES: SDR family oxidoreductase [Nocardiopsis]|uniref:NADP-dependent 3-hydroxy acid dehydrogenase YdfG n=1 Tax=Nocardiopsis sinuspersici TaxID=501010 RepID=A0A1V3BZ32_9ACTN|nr:MULTISPECIES: SDR family oxidoreductase [Nocardiopsis]NYH54892.1 NADP-dependent 3-hydroxy acid dehydrogenase YdfG [Nocardiopsis sinuspersici]OOC53642.1 oxidoreductase [Nocardiopsis sinuspersici]